MVYETLKAFILKHLTNKPTTIQFLICGGISGTIAQTSIFKKKIFLNKLI